MEMKSLPGLAVRACHEDALTLAFGQTPGASRRAGCCDVRPVWKLVAVLEGEVEERCEHLGGEFDGYRGHPVEALAHGK